MFVFYSNNGFIIDYVAGFYLTCAQGFLSPKNVDVYELVWALPRVLAAGECVFLCIFVTTSAGMLRRPELWGQKVNRLWGGKIVSHYQITGQSFWPWGRVCTSGAIPFVWQISAVRLKSLHWSVLPKLINQPRPTMSRSRQTKFQIIKSTSGIPAVS